MTSNSGLTITGLNVTVFFYFQAKFIVSGLEVSKFTKYKVNICQIRASRLNFKFEIEL